MSVERCLIHEVCLKAIHNMPHAPKVVVKTVDSFNCAHCGELVERPTNRSRKTFAKMKYCSLQCNAAARTRK